MALGGLAHEVSFRLTALGHPGEILGGLGEIEWTTSRKAVSKLGASGERGEMVSMTSIHLMR